MGPLSTEIPFQFYFYFRSIFVDVVNIYGEKISIFSITYFQPWHRFSSESAFITNGNDEGGISYVATLTVCRSLCVQWLEGHSLHHHGLFHERGDQGVHFSAGILYTWNQNFLEICIFLPRCIYIAFHCQFITFVYQLIAYSKKGSGGAILLQLGRVRCSRLLRTRICLHFYVFMCIVLQFALHVCI